MKKLTILFCILVSLSGPVLGREALGWFVDMSVIGASIICAADYLEKKDQELTGTELRKDTD